MCRCEYFCVRVRIIAYTSQQIPGLSRTFNSNVQDFPGPKSFSGTFQILEIFQKKSRTFQEAWEPYVTFLDYSITPSLSGVLYFFTSTSETPHYKMQGGTIKCAWTKTAPYSSRILHNKRTQHKISAAKGAHMLFSARGSKIWSYATYSDHRKSRYSSNVHTLIGHLVHWKLFLEQKSTYFHHFQSLMCYTVPANINAHTITAGLD